MDEMMILYWKYKMFMDIGFTGLGFLLIFGLAVYGMFDSRKRK